VARCKELCVIQCLYVAVWGTVPGAVCDAVPVADGGSVPGPVCNTVPVANDGTAL
jgi:hypothetical protein